MSKELVNFIFALFIIYFIYQLFINIVIDVWHWFVDFLFNIGLWIQFHMELILICLGVIIFVPLIIKILVKQVQPITTPPKALISFSTPVIEDEKHKETFNQGELYHTLNRTQKMKKIMNEMLKSKINRKSYHSSYIRLLGENGLGYVYFVKGPDGYTKIGLTHGDPFKRIIKIFGDVNTSYNVEVIHLIRTSQPGKTEKEFHLYFAKKRYTNPHDPSEDSEFFLLDGEDWSWIKQQIYPEKIAKHIYI